MRSLYFAVRNGLPLLITAASCGAMGWFLSGHAEQLRGIAIRRPDLLAVSVAASLAALMLPGPIFRAMSRRIGVDIGLAESTSLAILTTAINTFIPLHGGTAARAMYLQRRHGLELSGFAATFLGYNLLRLFAAAAAACGAAVGMIARQSGGWTSGGWDAGKDDVAGLRVLAVLSGVMATAALGTCLVRPAWIDAIGLRKLERFGWLRPLFQLRASWQDLTRSPLFLGRVLALVTLQLLADIVLVWAAWNAVGATVSAEAAVLIASFAILAALTGITPGGLGIVELVSAAIGTTVAVDPTHGIAAGLIARVVVMATLACITPAAFFLLSRPVAETPKA